jgi:hypothetical protein
MQVVQAGLELMNLLHCFPSAGVTGIYHHAQLKAYIKFGKKSIEYYFVTYARERKSTFQFIQIKFYGYKATTLTGISPEATSEQFQHTPTTCPIKPKTFTCWFCLEKVCHSTLAAPFALGVGCTGLHTC